MISIRKTKLNQSKESDCTARQRHEPEQRTLPSPALSAGAWLQAQALLQAGQEHCEQEVPASGTQIVKDRRFYRISRSER